MTADQWRRLKSLFQGALDVPAHARRGWLIDACRDDDALRREAELLLDAHETAGEFLEAPPIVELDELFESPSVLPPDAASSAAAGAAVDRRASLAPGTRLGTYEIVREVGRGGMGIVYLAEDLRLGRRVALKSLPEVTTGHDVLRERLRREARATATISHPGVATVYALEEIGGDLFLATEYVAGTTLRAVIDAGAIDALIAADFARQMLEALGAAHAAGIVHRDLKPENVLVTASGSRLKIVDFGIADVQGPGLTTLTREGALLGTPAYMAPEQLLGAPFDARADLYAFGIILDEILTGRHPARRGSTAGRETFVTTGERPLAARLAEIAARCMQLDPEARYPSAKAALDALGDTLGTGAAAPSAATAAPPDAARWWWEFHQGAAAVFYALMLAPAWRARPLLGAATGRTIFVFILAAAIVAATLRLHLWFMARSYPAELRWAMRRVRRWIHAADWLFALGLVSAGLLIGEKGSSLAILLLSGGIGAAVAFLFLEPATARAALKNPAAPRPM